MTEEGARRLRIPAALHEDRPFAPHAIDGPPQVVGLPLDLQLPLITMPVVRWWRRPPAPPVRKALAERPTPVADRFVGDGEAVFGPDLLYITEAEIDAIGQPHTGTDAAASETIAAIQGERRPVESFRRRPMLPHRSLTLTMPGLGIGLIDETVATYYID